VKTRISPYFAYSKTSLKPDVGLKKSKNPAKTKEEDNIKPSIKINPIPFFIS
jgi:hypothetical protein|tara:strand:- start:2056 stop:2211 length:156 start_codon:yes stop_codon:yes gene_type:complete